MSGCLCSLVTIAWSPPDRGSGHPFRCMAKDPASDHALHSLPTPYHTRPASWGTTASLKCSVCQLGVDPQGKAKPYQSFCVHAVLFLPPPNQGTGCILCHLTSLVSLLTGLQTGKSWARKDTYPNPHHAPIRELRLCLNNLYLPPDTRIDII